MEDVDGRIGSAREKGIRFADRGLMWQEGHKLPRDKFQGRKYGSGW